MKDTHHITPLTGHWVLVCLFTSLSACSDNHYEGRPNMPYQAQNTPRTTKLNPSALDIKDVIFDQRSSDCADYFNQYGARVQDISEEVDFIENVSIEVSNDTCTLTSNNIPNHNFDDGKSAFANKTSEVNQSFTISRHPSKASHQTQIGHHIYNGVMLNGVPIDILSASCYSPNSRQANRYGNIPIGCLEDANWMVDPLGPNGNLGADSHNAHTQPNGSYHYHGNPNALFDDKPGPNGSPVIGFAADGFPIYGSYFYDEKMGKVRKAQAGYTLKKGSRPSKSSTNPGGTYDGTYVQDWEFTNAGDLDECNGMTVNGQYGYYVTDAYPWIINCFSGTPDDSFQKEMTQGGMPGQGMGGIPGMGRMPPGGGNMPFPPPGRRPSNF